MNAAAAAANECLNDESRGGGLNPIPMEWDVRVSVFFTLSVLCMYVHYLCCALVPWCR